MSNDSRVQLAAVQADIAKAAAEHPGAVILAAIEVLIDASSGDNPALRDYKKLQIYRKIRDVLGRHGFV